VIVLDVPGGQVELRREDVARLRDTATAQSGRSSAARDLSLLLDRALTGARVVLRRAEVKALIDTAAAADLPDVADRVEAAAAG
jgi:hypothetical protein